MHVNERHCYDIGGYTTGISPNVVFGITLIVIIGVSKKIHAKWK